MVLNANTSSDVNQFFRLIIPSLCDGYKLNNIQNARNIQNVNKLYIMGNSVPPTIYIKRSLFGLIPLYLMFSPGVFGASSAQSRSEPLKRFERLVWCTVCLVKNIAVGKVRRC